MVLQQDKPIYIWGEADEGESVEVRFLGKKATAQSSDGRWMVQFPSAKAGGPHRLTISGENSITLTNVMVGEVWIASGQSNMEWPLTRTQHAQETIEKASHSNLRLFTVPRTKAEKPAQNVDGEWKICTPETVSSFSAVAYYFGRDLLETRSVPVGIIHTSWGGSPAEVWMSHETLQTDHQYREQILRNPSSNWPPSSLYNGMIAPLIPYSLRGAIWYQGESNASRAYHYRSLFRDMITNWRRDWGQGPFPFLEVQLAAWDKNRKRTIEEITAQPVESDWAELREAQLLAAQTLPNVGMAVTIDVGDKDDIHPQNKEPVGKRLALAARHIAYGEEIVYSGPLFSSSEVEGNQIVLHFEHVGSGLTTPDGKPLKGFAIAGSDHEFVWAEARIEGDSVVVSSPEVSNPVAVRYAWADYPVANLYNREGLPASPFRTDDFPMTTE